MMNLTGPSEYCGKLTIWSTVAEVKSLISPLVSPQVVKNTYGFVMSKFMTLIGSMTGETLLTSFTITLSWKFMYWRFPSAVPRIPSMLSSSMTIEVIGVLILTSDSVVG